MGMVRLGQPASASRVSRLPLWSARQPAGTDRWLYVSPEQGRWRAGFLFDPKIAIVDPDTSLECAVAFLTYATPDDQQGQLGYRTVLVRLGRCFRLLDDEGSPRAEAGGVRRDNILLLLLLLLLVVVAEVILLVLVVVEGGGRRRTKY